MGYTPRKRSDDAKTETIRYKDPTIDSTLFASMGEARGSESKGATHERFPIANVAALGTVSILGDRRAVVLPTPKRRTATGDRSVGPKKLSSPDRFQPAGRFRTLDHRTMVLQSQERFRPDRRFGTENPFGRGGKVVNARGIIAGVKRAVRKLHLAWGRTKQISQISET